MSDKKIYVVYEQGRYRALSETRSVLKGGVAVAVEGMDSFGDLWPITDANLVRVADSEGGLRSVERARTEIA
jgi:hypothetical protein